LTTHVEHVMGMAVSIDVRTPIPSAHLGDVLAPVLRWLHEVDATFSTYKPDSAISRIDRGALSIAEAPQVVRDVLDRCEELRRETNGAFDARGGGRLDPSGYVKGWAVDVASDLLVAAGVTDHCINAGGDLRLRGRPLPRAEGRWQIAIAHPLEHDAVCAILSVEDGAVATSGIAERGAHVVVPGTGTAAIDLASVTVVGPDLARADAYATVGLVLGLDAPRWLASLDGFEALVVDAAGMMWTSDGLPQVPLPQRA
jgi:thiamine biosynthesis lipoprotein